MLPVSDVAIDSVAGVMSLLTGACWRNVECIDESDSPLLRNVRSSSVRWNSAGSSLGGACSESSMASTCVDILFEDPILLCAGPTSTDASAELGLGRDKTTQLSAGGAILDPAKILRSCSLRPSSARLGRGWRSVCSSLTMTGAGCSCGCPIEGFGEGGSWTTGSRGAVETARRMTPEPANSTLTVVTEGATSAESFGAGLGTGCAKPVGGLGLVVNPAPSSMSGLPPNNFDIGAIHPPIAEGGLRNVRASSALRFVCAFDSFNLIAAEGSRVTSLTTSRK